MKAYVKYTGNYLQPLYNQDYEDIKSYKFKIGEIYEIEIKKPRNYEFHKKWFALLNLAFQNQEQFTIYDSFRKHITIECGYYNSTITKNGEFKDAKSISFASMDNIEFERLFNKTLDIVISDFVHADRNDIVSELENFY